MNTQETLYRLALTQLPGIGINHAHNLLQAAGNATFLFTHTKELRDLLPQVSPRLLQAFDHPEILRRCEAELTFAEKTTLPALPPMTKTTLPGYASVVMLHWSCFIKAMPT